MDTLPKHPLVLASWLRDKQKKLTPLALKEASGLATRTIKKYLWATSIPQEIQNIILKHSDIFTTNIIINIFASRQKHFEKENWKYLRLEVEKCIKKGPDYKPRKALNYPKGCAGGSLSQQRRRQSEKNVNTSLLPEKPKESVGFLQELSAQERFRERLATWVEVGNGEVRLKYYNQEDLERLLEIIT